MDCKIKLIVFKVFKKKHIYVSLVLIFTSILLLKPEYKLYYSEVRNDGDYRVEIYEIIPFLNLFGESGYYDALILVKNKNGKVLKKMRESPATMCPVSWLEGGILVGGEFYSYSE